VAHRDRSPRFWQLSLHAQVDKIGLCHEKGTIVVTLSLEAISARRFRLEAVRDEMRSSGIMGLVLSQGADMPWLCGYTASPHERPTLLVVLLDEAPVLFVPQLERALVPNIDDVVRVQAWAETEDPIASAARFIESNASASSRFAISDRAWASIVLPFQAELPEAKWVRSSSLLSKLRSAKDPSEVAVLREAAKAADRVADALGDGRIHLLGRSEMAISADVSAHLIKYGHASVSFSIVASGPNSSSPHHDPGRRLVERGDLVLLDFGGTFVVDGDVGYNSDMTRTMSVGEPSSKVRDFYDVLVAAHDQAVRQARPGVTAESVDNAARSVIQEAGMGEHFIHRTGHGIGIETHEDPYIVQGDTTVLVPGHTFSVEPGIYFSGEFGMRLEDIVVVTEFGCETLNNAARDLVVVDA
jgi:Xaa-Pro aminopeptidase